MNAAESLVRTLKAAGVDVCFANPGTTELHLVAALDAVPGVRAILGLFEGVCTGAADGFARMADRPALVLLHLGPGLANGIANLHNARRARVPLINLVGDHARWHVGSDPPLASDIESLARPVSAWFRAAQEPAALAQDAAEACAAAARAPGAVATLVVPADVAWADAAGPAAVLTPAAPEPVEGRQIERIARTLRESPSAALLLGGRGLRERSLRAAARVAATAGCDLLCETFPARMERGGSLPSPERLAYFPEQVLARLGKISDLVLAGVTEPVAFFGVPGLPGRLVPEGCRSVSLADPEQDVESALDALAEAVGAGPSTRSAPGSAELVRPTGELTPGSLGAAVAAVQPEGCVVVDEAITSGLPYFLASEGCTPHTYLGLAGGAIGQGLPCATGAAIACPDRPVLALQADGSAMYTLQSLWTQAREGLDVTTLICANRDYRILRIELGRSGIPEPGPQALSLTSLGEPALDWVALASGLGVAGRRVDRAEDLVRELEIALREPGPHLIEVRL